MRARRILEWLVTLAVGAALAMVLLTHGGLPGALSLPGWRGFGAAAGANLTPAQQRAARAQTILNGMSLDEKLGQLIVPMTTDTSLSASLLHMITVDHIGGYFVDSGNLTAPQLRAFSGQMQSAAAIPLMLATDFEGGTWNPIQGAVGPRPSPASIGASGNPDLARQKGRQDAQLLASVGLNVNFAPVVDVLTNPTNPILQGRTFGDTPQTVETYAAAYLDGLTAGGIAGTLKHFPGLGSSTVDPHKALPTVDRTLAQMQATELAPYRDLMQRSDVTLIMTTHMLIPALDPNLPTSISPAVINGLLRGQMGYTGVVISDALFMGGLSGKYTIPVAGLLAFEAGTDWLLGAGNVENVEQTIGLLKDALAKGDITSARIDQSVTRILEFKLRWNIIPATAPTPPPATPQARVAPALVADVRDGTMVSWP